MANEFKIKVNVQLDSSQAEAQMEELKNLGKDPIKIDIDLSDLKGQLSSLKNEFKNIFKVDNGAIGDIERVSRALKEVQDVNSSKGNSNAINRMVAEYKDMANTVSKLQKQINSGSMGEDGIKRTTSKITELTSQMDKLKSQITSLGGGSKLELFDSKSANKALVDMNQYMNKIETSAASLGTKLNSINFDHVDTDKIEKLQTELKQIQDIAKQDINLDMDVGSVLSDLERIGSEIKNLEKVENLASSFDRVKSSVNGTSSEIEQMSSSIKQLENLAGNLDGSFDKALTGVKSDLKSIQSEVKTSSKALGKGGLLGTWDDFKGNFAQFTLAEVAGDFITDGIRSMVRGLVTTVTDVDGALTNLAKVAPDSFSTTGDQLKTYMKQVQTVSKNSGRDMVSVIDSTASALQSGIKTINEALDYSELSAVYANVGDMEQDLADTQLKSIMSSYGGVNNSLTAVRENIKGAGKDYSTLSKYIDLAKIA